MVSAGTVAQDHRMPPAPLPSGEAEVLVRVTALDRRRHLLLDLTQRDFRIFEDKQEQTIRYFSSHTEEPLSLGILIDDSRNTLDEPDPPDWRLLSQFVHQTLGAGDEAFVATFDERTHFQTPWTANLSALDDALRASLAKTRDRATALYDAIYTVCEERFSGAPGRRVLVVVSDSLDDFSARPEQDVLDMAQRTSTIIYPVLPWVDASGEPLFRSTHFAELFAGETGGMFFTVVKPKDLEKSLAGIRALANHYYVVGYVPRRAPRAAPQNRPAHKIKVTCGRRGSKIYARRGYPGTR